MTSDYTGTPKDPLLNDLLDFAESHEFPGGVTLAVGGALISGVLVSVRQYAEHYRSLFDDRLRSLGDSELHGEFVPLFREGARWQDVRGRGGYVHLRRVRVHQPGDPESFQSPDRWWRIPTESVEGFTLEPPK